MTKKIAIIIDPVPQLNPKTDTTLFLAEEALLLGYKVFFAYPDHMRMQSDRRLMLGGFWVDNVNEALSCVEKPFELCFAGDFDIGLVRHEPPYDIRYLSSLYMISHSDCGAIQWQNNVSGILRFPEKFSPFLFHEFMPETIVTRQFDDVQEMYQQHDKLIVKPLYQFGGHDVFLLSPDDPNSPNIFDNLCLKYKEPLMVQAFLNPKKHGDKRIILLNGDPVGEIKRMPSGSSVRSNICSGGYVVETTLEEKEQHICDAIGDFLRDEGLYFVGLDIIGDYLTEINVTCPTGMRQVQELSGDNLAKRFWEGLV